ncbi:MAG: MucB/RseB C-terminal domain-containing protein [Gammaproteobacteria bacterium]|nr:MucB/RseB C-terminal domain-containing protein [Gammaproteobacteria bacterium]MBU1724408.1 MucB/RseB C-terminal domain-containing protein [Gammaproteobacteria bacterium]MBU2004373.1 MucB/RseB C-terminal domain-containing protein [Gammaproteobacteria bacterium]
MAMNIKRPVSTAVFAVLLASTPPVMANDAMALLSQMRTAVHTLNYAGTLVYVQGNDLSTYQITHSVEGGAEKDSVIRLSQGGEVPAQAVESFSLAKFQQIQPQMEQVYALDFGGEEQVANRSCRIVVARPRDRMRYLQRYCIDPVSGMLLKYSLVDRSHQPVEQLMFTALDIVEVVQPAGEAGFRTNAPALQAAPASAGVDANDGGWSFTSLPAGFRQVQSLMEPGSGVRQVILSDDMTSVSVFIVEPGQPGALENMELSAGAMNIFTAERDGYKVVLVGEVPVATLKKISEGLQHAR